MTQLEDKKFRPEIQGLRAIAVLSVLIYHVWPSALPGGFVGVDVFFVISGFLITEVLLRDVRNTGSIGLARFYGRRVKRLLPAASVVLLATVVCYPLLPSVSWESHADQLLASTLYYQNWWLGFQAVDYLGSEQSPGPLQHFWSLSVEEQYYFIWPLMFLAARILFARSNKDPVAVLGWSIAIVFAASLVHSIHFSHASPEMAYFASTTRAWELALGGLLAVFTARKNALVTSSAALSSLGLTLIASSFFIISRESIFPGYIALLPTIGTALVILAGDAASRWSPQALLRTSVFQYFGDISYSLYLWHWPVIIFYQHLAGSVLDPVGSVIVVVVSCALAHQTKVLIEDPFRQADYWGLGRTWPFLLGALCIGLTVAGSLYVHRAYQAALNESNTPQLSADPRQLVESSEAVAYTPSALQARQDRPMLDKLGCYTPQADEEPRICSFGDKEDELHLALVGDSHAVQWAPVLREIADLNGWRLTVVGKSACAFADIPVRIGKPPRSYDECVVWSNAVVDVLQELAPTHIVIGQSIAHRVYGMDDPVQSAERLAAAYVEIWRRVAAGGARVIAIKDTPRMPVDVPKCLSAAGKSIVDCSAERSQVLDREERPDPILLAVDQLSNAHILDFSDHICGARVCPAVADGVLIWRDSHHLTKTFVMKLEPVIAAALETIMGRQVSFRPGLFNVLAQPEQSNAFLSRQIDRAKADRPDIYRDGCIRSEKINEAVVCEYGSMDGDTHIVLAGDTRAGQWLPALQKLSEIRSLRISTVIGYACPLGGIAFQGRDCRQWTKGLVGAIGKLAPDAVIYSQSRGYRVPDTQRGLENAHALADEIVDAFAPLADLNLRLILLPDAPRMVRNVTECLATETGNVDTLCSVTKVAALPNSQQPDPLVLAAGEVDKAEILDLTEHICPKDGLICPPLIDEKIVWRSKYLVTATYASTLSEPFDRVIFRR